MPRIPPLPEAEWPEQLRPLLERRPPAVGSRMGDNNIFATFARHEQLFAAWLPLGTFLLTRGVLDPRERELLILRTAFNCRSPYEWGQHVRLGERLGISGQEITRVAEGPAAPGWSPREQALLRAADELHADARVSETTWAELAAGSDAPALLEITMLVGHYQMVAFALNSLEIELDEGLEGLPGD